MSGLKAKAGLLFFVSAGIFVGLVVFGNTVAPKKIHPNPALPTDTQIAQEGRAPENSIGEAAPLPENMPAQTIAELPSGSANITQSLASLIGKNIVDKNPEGPAGDDLTVMGADGIADIAITESLKHFNPAYFLPEIPQGEINIDNTQGAATYRAAAEKIIALGGSVMPANGTPVPEKMKLLAASYGSAASELRALAVPQALAEEHIRAIRLAEGRRRILEAVADYENDPIYAMLALKLWDTLK